MPQISVIIPTYNRERFIVKAIDSVLNQSFTDYEILVIDDGSTDNSKSILKAYGNKIKYIYQLNMGVSSARNAGIKVAQGEWIAFLDSDDEWMDEYLSLQMTQIKKYPQAIGHITNAFSVNLNGEKIDHFGETKLIKKFKSGSILIWERPLRMTVNYSPWFLQSTILRKDVLVKNGLFDPKLSIAEDLDVICRSAAKGPFTFNNQVLVNIFRRNEGLENLGKRSEKNIFNRYESFYAANKNILNEKGLSFLEKIAVKRQLGIYLRALGNLIIFKDNENQAWKYYLKALVNFPSFRSLIRFFISCLPQKLRHFIFERVNITYDDRGIYQ